MPADIPKSSVFSLVDTPMEDPLTRLRYEIKYAYSHVDLTKLETILKVNNRPIRHSHETSIVYSIYFDDDRLTAYRENVDGIGKRLKLRLRWYDTPFPEKPFFFEIKRRFHSVITKDRYAIVSRCPLAKMTYHEIVQALLQTLPEIPRELLRARQTPVVIIRYKRRHYTARHAYIPVRITLDHAITAFEQLGKRRLQIHFGTPMLDRIVVEAKAAVGRESHIPELLYPLKPRQTKFSKYALGCQQIGAATGIYSMG